MIFLEDEDVASHLPWQPLIDAIERALADVVAPTRHGHAMTARDGDQGQLLIMPAWRNDDVVGLKVVTYWPGNSGRGLPTHGANYVLLDARTGRVRAVLAAEALTHRRTAALSVIAAQRLLHGASLHLTVIGTGPVSAELVRAHAASGRFEAITLCGRSHHKVEALACMLRQEGIDCNVEADLEAAVRSADMIATATSAVRPVLCGAWLAPNAHVALFGGFTPRMREADDEVMERSAEVWVDTLAALDSAGDLLDPIGTGALDREKIRGDLAGLVNGSRAAPQGVSVFKSVGIASADFAAATLALETMTGQSKAQAA